MTPRQQDAAKGTQRRLNELSGTLNSLPPSIRNSFVNYMERRAQRGTSVLGRTESQLALRAAATGQAQAPAPERSPWDLPGNLLSNARDLASVVPKLVMPNRGNPLYKEVHQTLTEGPGAISAAVDQTNPIDVVSDLAAAPGVRLIPGAFVASNLDEPSELARNPLFTALDVLPYAKAAAKATPAVRTAQSAYDAALPQMLEQAKQSTVRALEGQGTDPGALGLRPPPVFRTALTRRVQDGQVVPNRLGQATERIGERIAESPVGQAAARTFGFGRQGRANRALTGLASRLDLDVARLASLDPESTARLAASPDPSQARLGQLLESQRQVFDEFAETRGRDAGYLEDLQARMTSGDRSLLEPDEAALASRLDDLNADYRRVLASEFPERVVNVDNPRRYFSAPGTEALAGELLDMPKYQAVAKADRQWRAAALAEGELGQNLDSARRAILDDQAEFSLKTVPGGAKELVVESTERSSINQVADHFAQLADEMPSNIPKSQAQAFADMREFVKARDAFARAVNPEAMGNAVKQMSKSLKAMRRRRGVIGERVDSLVDDGIAQLRQAERAVKDAAKIGTPVKAAKKLARAEKRVRQQVERAAPARFQPAVRERFQGEVESIMEDVASRHPEATTDLAAVREGVFSGLGRWLGDDELASLWSDLERGWVELKEQGLDPVYVHSADDAALRSLNNPKVAPRPSTPGQVKERTWDASPTPGGPFVALSHQAMELVREMGQRELVDTVSEVWAKPYGQWLNEQTARLEARGVANPAQAARQWMRDNTVEWPPQGAGFKRRAASVGDSETLRIPKSMSEVVTQLTAPPVQSLTRLMDPVMKVFRTAVLPLSVRWQVNNVLGNSLILTVSEGRKAWATLPQATRDVGKFSQAIKRAYTGEQAPLTSTVPRGAPQTRGGQSGFTFPERLAAEPPTSTNRLVATRRHATGRTLANWWDGIQRWKEANGHHPISALYAANQWVDDISRTMAALGSYDKALKAGKGVAEAELEAAAAVRRVSQSWDTLLPAERQILRSVFPFYSFGRYIVGFSLRYPVDHPLRTAVTASLARAEIEDAGTGLPGTFHDLLQLTGMDDDGNALFFSPGAANPFRDVTDWFTLEGFVGQTNPLISATLQALGVDPAAGGPLLYPETTYNPETGRREAKSPGLIESLVSSTLPQSQLVQNLILDSEEWSELVQSNPQAAQRQLLGQLGIPTLVQERNVPEAIFGAERNRYQQLRQEWNTAIEEGDFGGFAQRYPALAPMVDQYQAQYEAMLP